MNFDLSPEQAMLRDAAQRFVREQYGFEHRRELLATPAGWSPELWQCYADFGWLGLGIGEEQGGLGCTPFDTAVLMEQLGAGLVLEPVVASAVLASRLLERCGNEAHRAACLPAMAAGELIVVLAHDEEPALARDDRLPATVAVPQRGGYRLDGHKMLVVGCPQAQQVIVSARLQSGGDDRLGLFLLDAQSAGLRLDAYRLIDGRACGDLLLEGVSCPEAALLAEGEAALAALDEAMDHARVAAMSEAIGSIESCLGITAEHLKTRVQFGQPLARFQSLQHLMAEMFVEAQDARSILYCALAHLDAAPADRRKAVAAAQLIVGQTGRSVSAKGLQMHGGYGLTEEYRISHHFRHLFVLDKLYGGVPDRLMRME